MITPARQHNKRRNVLLRVFLALAALSAFPSNNNGVLVSAAAPPSRNLKSSTKATKATKSPSACGKGEKLVEVKINTDSNPRETSWEIQILNACSGDVIDSGVFDGGGSSYEVCVAENGRYKILINDHCDEFDYKLLYDGKVMEDTNSFDGEEVLFGKESCKTPKGPSKKTRRLRNKQRKLC